VSSHSVDLPNSRLIYIRISASISFRLGALRSATEDFLNIFMGINSSQPPEDLRSAGPVCPGTFTMFTTFTGCIMMLMIHGHDGAARVSLLSTDWKLHFVAA
jgi:hypothetical protein